MSFFFFPLFFSSLIPLPAGFGGVFFCVCVCVPVCVYALLRCERACASACAAVYVFRHVFLMKAHAGQINSQKLRGGGSPSL